MIFANKETEIIVRHIINNNDSINFWIEKRREQCYDINLVLSTEAKIAASYFTKKLVNVEHGAIKDLAYHAFKQIDWEIVGEVIRNL